jgi:uncharacterized protein (DUF2164 family)
MSKVKREWDILTPETKEKAVKEIMGYFLDERNEEMGIIAAEDILDFFLQNTGKYVYNKAIDDAKGLLLKQLEETDIAFEVLKKSQ